MSEPPELGTVKVLLVDRDFRTSQRLAKLLMEDGFEVEVARDGATAIEQLSRAPAPSVLITELTLPLADGATIVRYARSQNPRLRVFVLTGYPHLFRPSSFVKPTPVVLTKPLDYERLLELLGKTGGSERCPCPASSLEN